MEKCLQCSKELKHVPGRKKKSFCDVNCRNKYFYAKRKREVELAKAILPLPPLIVNGPEFSAPYPVTGPKAAVALHNAENQDQFTRAYIMSKKEADELFKRPKTLDELKTLCPPELKGLDRSNWISTERQKYGI